MKKLTKVLVSNPGTLHAFRLARELKRQGIDVTFATSLFIPQRLLRIFPSSWQERLANRIEEELDGHVVQYPVPELIHLIVARFFPSKAALLIRWRNRLFGKRVAERHLQHIDVVWSFDTASEHLFQEAKKKGITCILDMSSAYLYSDKTALTVDRSGCAAKEADGLRSREKEILLADIIVAASSFSKSTIISNAVFDKKIAVIPYGVDLVKFYPKNLECNTARVISFVFVGWFSPKKGIYDLLEAWEEARFEDRARLLMAGGTRENLSHLRGKLPSNVECLGKVSRKNIGMLLNTSDVFVFPSRSDGFGLVILEAMASGLPVLTTTNTAGPDLIQEGSEGFIVEPENIKAISEKMRLLAENHDLRNMMGGRARKKAEEYTWEEYGKKCAQICQAM